ncbi:hypothetical protein Thiofri_02297 [Thiorhodovibrio frisius]|nr:hypothetical protein Thiofri_02297 [Thiorhodovibrio frisius]
MGFGKLPFIEPHRYGRNVYSCLQENVRGHICHAQRGGQYRLTTTLEEKSNLVFL